MMNFLEKTEKGKLIFYPQRFAKVFIKENNIYSCEGSIYMYENGNYNFYLKKLSLLPNNLNKLICDNYVKNIDEISNNYPNLILEYHRMYTMELQENVPNLMENIFGERYFV